MSIRAHTMRSTGANERFLLPGQWFFGSGGSVRTLLGSCVAVTMWHPRLLTGGMCHFVLPSSRKARGKVLDGRYGDQAIAALVQSAQRMTAYLLEYRVGLFGGGQMFSGPSREQTPEIGENNIEAAHAALDAYGLSIRQIDVGGSGHRNLALDLETGAIVLRRGPLTLVKDER